MKLKFHHLRLVIFPRIPSQTNSYDKRKKTEKYESKFTNKKEKVVTAYDCSFHDNYNSSNQIPPKIYSFNRLDIFYIHKRNKLLDKIVVRIVAQ